MVYQRSVRVQTGLQRHCESGNLKMSVSDGLTGVGARDAYASKNHISKVFHISICKEPSACLYNPWGDLGGVMGDHGLVLESRTGGTILAINHRDAANTTILYQTILVINHRDTSIPCHAAPKLRPESISLCFQQSRQGLSSVGCSKPRVWCQLLGSQRSIGSQHQTLSVCLLHHFH